jgi:formylglycine-generating enzyme required for sulfatase activity
MFEIAFQSLLLVHLFLWPAYGESVQIHTLSGQRLDLYQGYHALVVGVERYDHWPPRTHAAQNALEVSRELRRLGVSVRLLIDPTLQQMQLALDEFAKQEGAEPESGLVVYYAGNAHNVTSEKGQTTGWIIPKDAPRLKEEGEDLETYAVSTGQISALADQIQSRHVFFLFDAPLSADAFQVETPTLKMVDTESTLPARQFITRGETDQEVADHDFFKRFLLQGLQGEADLVHDGLVSASELGHYLADRVSKLSLGQLRPRFGRLSEADGNGGDFIIKTTTRSHAPLDDAITNTLGMQFVHIRPGSFMMGSPTGEPGRSNDETRHRVRLTRPYLMQTTEVTVEQFRQFVNATGYRTKAETDGGRWTAGSGTRWTQTPGTSWRKPGLTEMKEELPVICVTWKDATAFAQWLSAKEYRNYRLPTEAQWEYAGRAGISTPFSTGLCLSTSEANYGKIGHAYQKCTATFRTNHGQPVKVGLSEPNPWRLYNIHGNVSEWCQDWYGPYPSGKATDPEGPDSGSERVMRGGHWQADAAGCRFAKRWRIPPNLASDVVGFRLVLIP